jgi:hypothetical protein
MSPPRIESSELPSRGELANVYGQVGTKVDILGEYFAAGSIVSFNGVPAQNPEITSTYIKATVPECATTGYITVTTRKGKLKSNKPFVVH